LLFVAFFVPLRPDFSVVRTLFFYNYERRKWAQTTHWSHRHQPRRRKARTDKFWRPPTLWARQSLFGTKRRTRFRSSQTSVSPKFKNHYKEIYRNPLYFTTMKDENGRRPRIGRTDTNREGARREQTNFGDRPHFGRDNRFSGRNDERSRATATAPTTAHAGSMATMATTAIAVRSSTAATVVSAVSNPIAATKISTKTPNTAKRNRRLTKNMPSTIMHRCA